MAPAEGDARVRRPPAGPVATERGEPPATLFAYLRALFTDGGATIITPGGQALVQPDGDLVMILDPDAAPDPVEAWSRHVDEVVAWLTGLQRRLTTVTRRLGLVHAGVLGLSPLLVACFADGSGDTTGWAAPAARLAAVAVAVVSLADTLLSRGDFPAQGAPAAPAGRSPRWWRRVRSSRAWGVAISLAPSLLAAASALLHGSAVGAALVVLGPVLVSCGTFVARWQLQRVLA